MRISGKVNFLYVVLLLLLECYFMWSAVGSSVGLVVD
jgi:hypothetical protein